MTECAAFSADDSHDNDDILIPGWTPLMTTLFPVASQWLSTQVNSGEFKCGGDGGRKKSPRLSR
jgi:hypothetical protein